MVGRSSLVNTLPVCGQNNAVDLGDRLLGDLAIEEVVEDAVDVTLERRAVAPASCSLEQHRVTGLDCEVRYLGWEAFQRTVRPSQMVDRRAASETSITALRASSPAMQLSHRAISTPDAVAIDLRKASV